MVVARQECGDLARVDLARALQWNTPCRSIYIEFVIPPQKLRHCRSSLSSESVRAFWSAIAGLDDESMRCT